MSMDISCGCRFYKIETCLKFAVLPVLITAFIFIFNAQQSMAAEAAWKKSLATGDSKLSNQFISQARENYKRAIQELGMVAHTPEDEARCLRSLANILALENRTDEAVKTYKEALAILEKSYGKSSARILPTLFALGSIYESAGDHDLAMPYYQRAIAINQSQHGQFCPTFANQFLHDQIIDKSANSVASYGPRQNNASFLAKQAGLQSSKVLEDLLPNYKEDILRKEENSDQELTSIFNGEIAKNADKDITSDGIDISSSYGKQSDTGKRSRRI